MRKVIFANLLTILALKTSIAQNDSCNCLLNLNKTIEQTERNYAGFPAKVNNRTISKYNALIKRARKDAVSKVAPKECFYVIRDYVKFFNDKHFVFSYYNEADFDVKIVELTENSYRSTFKNSPGSSPEGIWINPDSTLKLAIRKSSAGFYEGIVVESKDAKIRAGLVYMTLQPNGKNFVAKQFNVFMTTDVPAKQQGNLLQLWNYETWGRTYPEAMSTAEIAAFTNWRHYNFGLELKKYDSNTVYVKIPTFNNNDDKIQQLISNNDSLIRSVKNFVIDLTGNGGGSTGWVILLPYLMTNTIYQQQDLLRISPENVRHKIADLEPFVSNPIPDEYKKYFPSDVVAAYKKAYEEIPVTSKQFYPIPSVIFPLDTITKNPEKVAILFDELCGSSTEYFFNLSAQSKKVIRYGNHTIGMMDYVGMSVPTPLPYNKFILKIPILKSSWTDKKPIDQTGFSPDINLSKLPQTEWLKYVVRDMND